MRAGILLLAGLPLLAVACAAGPDSLAGGAGPAGAETGEWRQQAHAIPVTQADGTQRLLAGRVCRPAGDAPSRLVVIAHGSPPVASRRPTMSLTPCTAEAPRWFLQRGFTVVMTLRRGYGATGGEYAEGVNPCTEANYVHAARESARDLAATVRYAETLPGVRPDHVAVVGQSAGGWAALGLNAALPPGVSAVVSMAGGRGGHVDDRPNNNCHPEALAAAAGQLGAGAGLPMLWIYTANDSYFAPPLARSLYDAYAAAGGRAEFHQLGPFGTDGHNLFFGRGGSAIWGPLMEEYLRHTS